MCTLLEYYKNIKSVIQVYSTIVISVFIVSVDKKKCASSETSLHNTKS